MQAHYYNLKLQKHPSDLTKFARQCGWYIFIRLLFRMAVLGDIFQQIINEMFKGLPNVFGIADDTLIVGYDADGRDCDNT